MFDQNMSDIMLDRPLASPPSGVTANIEQPATQITLAYLTLAVALSTTTLFAWIRFLVKLLIIGKLHLEDYLIPFAWLAAMGQIATGFMLNDFAPWIHSWDINMETFGRYLLWYRLNTIFYNISIVLIKVSMLIQVLRIFVPHGSQSRNFYIIHGLIWSNLTYYILAVFLMIFTCGPIEKAWKPWLPGKCLNMAAIGMSTQVINLVGDLAILLLTQRAIWNLMRVDRRQRIKLAVVFFAGIIPCGFAIMCVYFSGKMMGQDDFTYDSALMTLACYGEISSGMFVLFLPILPRFFTHIKTVSSFRSTANRHSRPSGVEFSDVGANKERKQSLWHVSYTQQESEDKLPIVPPVPSLRKEDFGGELAREETGSSSINSLPIQRTRQGSDDSIHKLPIQGTDDR